VLKPSVVFNYADTTIVAEKGGERVAYLLPGEFPGFKTFIDVMLALNPNYKILGLEIMEHEEDPGLGADIEKEFFKNQFKNKDFKKIKELQVIKEPLPEEYKRYLETRKWAVGEFSKEEIEKIRSTYQDQDIYALTGATISSKSVTDGVKGMVKKFAYRIEALDEVISNQEIDAAF
jgi:electron transport complex protein RnfG